MAREVERDLKCCSICSFIHSSLGFHLSEVLNPGKLNKDKVDPRPAQKRLSDI